MKKIFLLIGVVGLSACVSENPAANQQMLAQNQSISASGSYTSQATGIRYQNSALGLAVQVPANWKSLNRQQLNELADDDMYDVLQKSNGNKLVADYMEKQIREDKVRLFYAFEDNHGLPPNAIFSVSLYRKGLFDPNDINGLKNQIAYVVQNSQHDKNVSGNANFPLTLIDGKPFVHYEYIRTNKKGKVYEECYVRPQGDYYINLFFIYKNDPRHELTQKILQTAKLNPATIS